MPGNDETALELKPWQTPAALVFDTEQEAFAQSLAHATDIDIQEFGGFRRREALFQQRHILRLTSDERIVVHLDRRRQIWLREDVPGASAIVEADSPAAVVRASQCTASRSRRAYKSVTGVPNLP